MLEIVKRLSLEPGQYASHIADLKSYWDDEFDDIPWKSKPIRVTIDQSLKTLEFYFIFENILELPDIDVSLVDTHDVDATAILFDWKRSEEEPGLFLTISGLMPNQLDQLIFSQNPKAVRPAKLVCLQKDGTEWVVIYNSFDRFKRMIMNWTENHSGQTIEFDKYFFRFVEFLLSAKYSEASQFFEQTPELANKKKELSWIPEKFDVAFNAHGIKRIFKYWSLEERHAYLNSALNIIEVLKPKFENICISGGSILGLKRTGKLLDHDDDLDIVVGVKASDFGGLGPTLDALAQCLTAAGFKVKGYFFAHLWIETDAQSGQTLDVFVAIMEDDFASFYPSHRKSMKSTDLFPSQLALIENIEVPVPGDVDGYLEGVYGKNWRTPDHGFRHPWNRKEYSDLSGTRKHKIIWTRGEVAALSR